MLIKLILIAIMMGLSIAGFAQSVSDETQPVTCGNRLVTGIICSGRYCDNITPICGQTIKQIFDIKWTKYVSEEGSGIVTCYVPSPFGKIDWPKGEPAFITGFACKGNYCDNIALECVLLKNTFPSSFGGKNCHWTKWISEEEGYNTIHFPSGYGAIKIGCSGSYCDNKRFFICPFKSR